MSCSSRDKNGLQAVDCFIISGVVQGLRDHSPHGCRKVNMVIMPTPTNVRRPGLRKGSRAPGRRESLRVCTLTNPKIMTL